MTTHTSESETLNLEIRKFLKRVGITSQRELEMAVHQAIEQGRLRGDEALRVEVMLSVPGLNLVHRVEGEIRIGP